MKKILCACALTSMLVASAVSASEFTINPMVGASHSKAGGTNAAVGLEAGYSDFIFGYTYTGDENKNSDTYDFQHPDVNDGISVSADTFSQDKYRAHSLYAGYQFDLGAGHLAVKAGVEMSKYSVGTGFDLRENGDGGITNTAGLNVSGSSNYEYAPMVGVGYYMDNGLNFNLHYTWQDGQRDMSYSASAYNAKPVTSPSHKVKNDVSNRDFSTVMFTVGYRF
ncbi:hypothetical protein [Shewanella sp. UCD-KL12]|uniref:hypothetical protein n=1 Tax=Shewanella sp. UCD-KL12 TaxID=1917163 RepID=UPI0009705AD8|nr:hypothetical protein [Shewanella sp. UCD-KL12]